METFGNILGAKNVKKGQQKFFCKSCDFECCKKYSWERHISTAKHQKYVNGNKKGQKGQIFICEFCNKEYNERTGLWKHKIKCNIIISNNNINTNTNKDDIIQLLLKQNNDLIKEQSDIKNIILEIVKNGPTYNTNTYNSNNITNSNNKAFNLNFFLNETCKNAMNINEFVESVKLQVSDLENVGKVGYIEGISNIIIKNLKALDIEKRPIHCTDKKREVIYVKDDNIWEKEDETNYKIRKAIRMIAHKNICLFKEYREKYPDCEEYDSNKNEQYNKIVYESMGGKGDNDYEKNNKIIKNIAKEVFINKNYTDQK